MNNKLKTDLEETAAIFEKIKEQSVAYLRGIDERPVSATSITGKFNSLNNEGLGAMGAIEKFNTQFEHIMVGSSGPRYWGFVTGGSTPASIAGDWLATVYDQNTQSINGEGDISATIEKDTINLLLDLFELPKDFFGGFVSGATLSNFTCLAVGRQWLGKTSGLDIARNGVSGNMNVLTATPHSSALKSLSMLGMGSSNFIKVDTIGGNREAMDIENLVQKIEALNGQPFILISSGGTVNTVDFDDLAAIAALKKQYQFWWHIDAAFGAFAILSEKHKHLLSGWEMADSITVDCHKWLNVPYENAVFLVKEAHIVLQTETFQNSNAPYLGNPFEKFSYLNLLPENSRRLKALPVWFSLMAYGKNGYRSIVENSIQMALLFSEAISNSNQFELLAPIRLNTVCFTLRGKHDPQKVNTFLSNLNRTGKVFMTPTFYNNHNGIRAAFVNWRTTAKDIAIAIAEMETAYRQLSDT
jgi:glutamate/tyrosine decarboxylase-like PLP-dependent enzyme